MSIKAVAFDAFGTVCYIRKKVHPYQRLFEQLHIDFHTGAHKIMTYPGDIRSFCQHLNIPLDNTFLDMIEQQIEQEIQSITFYDDVIPTLTTLKESGISTAIISNLAKPYAPPLHAQLHGHITRFVFSYDVGYLKPHPKMFDTACHAMNCHADELLMVGDSLSSDISGAITYGAHAVRIIREKKMTTQGITTLYDIIPQVIDYNR